MHQQEASNNLADISVCQIHLFSKLLFFTNTVFQEIQDCVWKNVTQYICPPISLMYVSTRIALQYLDLKN